MKKRKALGKGRYGTHGRIVRLWVEGDLIRAQWREGGRRRTKSWSNTPANRSYAKAWAAAFVEARERPTAIPRLTVRELWLRYQAAEWDTLRPKSQKVYAHGWRAWEVFVTPTAVAEDMGMLTVAEFRADRVKAGWAIGTTRKAIDVVKIVYLWGLRAKLLSRNEVRDYRFKVAKADRTEGPAEYTQDEYRRILAEIPLDQRTGWRARAVLEICGLQGARQNAVLHLQKADVDFEAEVITWRAEWDKVGDSWEQPLRPRTAEVLRAVLAWHERLGLETPWFFPAGSRKNVHQETYSPQSLWAALRRAEDAAGIPHQDRRGAHGFRRMLFGDVLAATGSIPDAMNTINDRDLRVAGRYNKRRLGQVREAFAKLDRNSTQTATAPESGAASKTVKRGD